MPAYPSKRKRLGLLNITLALTLGAIIWWCVDSWLSIKPDYTLRFPNRGELATDRNAYLQTWLFNAKALDTEDQYLVIERPNVPELDSITTEVRDLRTSRLIVKHSETFTERLDSLVNYPLSQTKVLANAEGTLFQTGEYQSRDNFKRDSVCEWNLLTNKRRIIKPPLPGTQYLLSRDSSRLITFTCLSPFMPALIGPSGWANCLSLTLLADQHNQFHELGPVFVRVYSLPDLRMLSSLMLSSPHGRSEKMLALDGSVLVLGNPGLFPKLQFDWGDLGQLHPLQPTGLAVYDLMKGKLRHCVADHPGTVDYLSTNELSSNLVEAALKKDIYPKKGYLIRSESNIEELISRVREVPPAYYHLPSNSWIEMEGDRIFSSAITKQVERILSYDTGIGDCRIWEIAADGKVSLLKRLTVSLKGDVSLLNNTDQQAFIRESHLQLPQWLHDVAGKFITAIHWIEKSSHSLIFYDYMEGRELGNYKLRSNQPLKLLFSPKGNHLILNTTNETEHEVAVFSLPVKAWSPWWARSAGLLVGIVVLLWCLTTGRAATRAA